MAVLAGEEVETAGMHHRTNIVVDLLSSNADAELDTDVMALADRGLGTKEGPTIILGSGTVEALMEARLWMEAALEA